MKLIPNGSDSHILRIGTTELIFSNENPIAFVSPFGSFCRETVPQTAVASLYHALGSIRLATLPDELFDGYVEKLTLTPGTALVLPPPPLPAIGEPVMPDGLIDPRD